MKIISVKDYSALSRAAANIIAAQVILKPRCVLGLATGSSPVGTYQELVRRCQAGELDFSQVRTVNLDEYVGLDRDHDQSYAYFMRDNLFNHINLDLSNTNVPDGMDPDGDSACARYDQIIRDLGGIDLQLLGLGVNGHIGFNEPADAFSLGTTRWSSPTAPGRPTAASSPAWRRSPPTPAPWASGTSCRPGRS